MAGTNTLIAAGNSGGVPSVFNAASYEQLNGTIQSSETTETKQQQKTNSAVTFSRFRVKVKTNTDATGRTVNFRKNTAAGNQTVSITGSTTGNFTDATHTDSLVAGDLYNVNRPSDTVNGTALNFIYMQANNTTPLAFYSNGATTTVGHIALSTTTQYAALFGYTDANATEANQQVKHESAGTLKNLSANLDTSSSGTTTMTHRKNTANGNQTLSISSGTTGITQDTTHTDSLLAGDLLATSFASTNSSGNFEYIAYEFAGTTSAHMMAGRANGNVSFSGSVTRYHPFAGDVTASISTEASAQMSTDFAVTFSKLRCHIQSNTTATATMVFRSATVTQNQTVSVTSGGTGQFEDTTHSDSIAANTTFNAQIVTGTVTSLLWLETAVTSDDGSNTGSVAYTLTSDNGTYAQTGYADTMSTQRLLSATKGTYTLTGYAVTENRGIKMTAVTGAYTLTGRSAVLSNGLMLSAANGTYTLTGNSVTENLAIRFTAAQGTYSLTGNSAVLGKGRHLLANFGAYHVTGYSSTHPHNRILVAHRGHYQVHRHAVILRTAGVSSIIFPTDTGEYLLNGEDIVFGKQRFRVTFADLGSTTFSDWPSLGGADYDSYLDANFVFGQDMMTYTQTPYLYVFVEEGSASDVGLILNVAKDWAEAGNIVKLGTPIQVYRYRDGFLLSVSKNRIRGKGRVLQLQFTSETGKDFNVRGWAMWLSKNAKV